MTICTLASSSSGNATLVSYERTHFLIDAGISLKRIREGLNQLSLTPDDLTAVLVTHEHSDHVKGLEMLVKHHKTPIFSSRGAAHAISNHKPVVEPFISTLETGVEVDMGNIAIESFATPHDASESIGFRLTAGNKTLAYATDLGHVSMDVLEAMYGAFAVIIESNHDKQMLSTGPYPSYLKKRVSSPHGHLSNPDCGKFAVELVKSGTRIIQLAHLSRENNTPELARSTVGKSLEDKGISLSADVSLEVAEPFTLSRVIKL